MMTRIENYLAKGPLDVRVSSQKLKKTASGFLVVYCLLCLLFVVFQSLRVLLFLPLNVLIACWFCLSFDTTIPKGRRLAITYLFVVGILYFWTGAAGSSQIRSTNFVAYGMLNASVALPAAVFVHAIRNHLSNYPTQLHQLSDDLRGLSNIVVYFGLVAIAAAIAMFLRSKIGYFVWLGLIVFAACVGLWYLIVSSVSHGFLTENQIWLALWMSSYVAALWFTRSD